jgi:phosphonate transport system permease protein
LTTEAKSTFFTSVLANRSELETRYPAVFRSNWVNHTKIAVILTGVVALAAYAILFLDIEWGRVLAGFARLGQFVSVMLPPNYGTTEKLIIYLYSLLETIAIAFLGTILAAVLALPFGFLAARNVVPEAVTHFLARRSLDTIRSVNILIWALIWINVVGLGPFAGVLAIMTADFGLFGKLFSEAIEASDAKAAEGVISTGGSYLQRLRFGLLPGILPIFVSQVLYQIESNTRSATIIGIVGAGGIGAYFQEEIRLNEWQHVAFLTILMLITVAVIDLVSTRVRHAIIGGTSGGAAH